VFERFLLHPRNSKCAVGALKGFCTRIHEPPHYICKETGHVDLLVDKCSEKL
jgi:hypothetical protein